MADSAPRNRLRVLQRPDSGASGRTSAPADLLAWTPPQVKRPEASARLEDTGVSQAVPERAAATRARYFSVFASMAAQNAHTCIDDADQGRAALSLNRAGGAGAWPAGK
ncbi:unnamed protein product [Phytophthora lilii]|uniref:Unnamed protein product n=1 Tax=Phytophthora lilii TaxID=2077276 RepID=A0A9W6TFT2_9STRA|nr:unnamed protein product [Phytophthora lilii]